MKMKNHKRIWYASDRTSIYSLMYSFVPIYCSYSDCVKEIIERNILIIIISYCLTTSHINYTWLDHIESVLLKNHYDFLQHAKEYQQSWPLHSQQNQIVDVSYRRYVQVLHQNEKEGRVYVFYCKPRFPNRKKRHGCSLSYRARHCLSQ